VITGSPAFAGGAARRSPLARYRALEGPMTETKKCIYCREDKPVAEFSEEHIIPKFMGGSSECYDAVTNDVCDQCNSLFGRFVDASVAKGFFLNSIEGTAWQGCFDYDEKNGNVFPLTYLGKCDELEFDEGEEVEVWLCPDGGTAWDLHEKRSEDFQAFSGGDPLLRRKDRLSRTYVFFRSEVPYWVLSNFQSLPSHFKEEAIFFGTDIDIEDRMPIGRAKGVFCRKDATAIAERDKIRQPLDKERMIHHEVKLDLLFDVRFLAKLAIAFGHQLLGNGYGTLQYTDMLRTLLWTRRANLDPAQHRIRMRSYFAGLQDYAMRPIRFPLGFSFVIKAVQSDIVLAIVFPSGHSVQVSITDTSVDTAFDLKNYSIRDHVLISIPQLKRTIGPVNLDDYVAWAIGSHSIPDLDDAKARISPREKLPPF
jgi:HNH endonuclease